MGAFDQQAISGAPYLPEISTKDETVSDHERHSYAYALRLDSSTSFVAFTSLCPHRRSALLLAVPFVCLLAWSVFLPQAAKAQSNEWTWMSGAEPAGVGGVGGTYGALGCNTSAWIDAAHFCPVRASCDKGARSAASVQLPSTLSPPSFR